MLKEEKSIKNPTEEVSIIDFSATEYSFEEGNNTVNVTLKRYGDTSIETMVSFKAADLISIHLMQMCPSRIQAPIAPWQFLHHVS